jgi:hypothetical protein
VIPAQRDGSHERLTRRPSGLTPWPVTLISSTPHAGATWACAAASGSELVARTLWVGAGEDEPDDYANVPGADFEIVPTSGTYADIVSGLRWASSLPAGDDGRPNLLVLDSGTGVWDLLGAMAHAQAVQRALAARTRPGQDDEVVIGRDLWTEARERWDVVMDVLRAHPGPSLITARLDEVPIIDDEGRATRERLWRVQGHKTLPSTVDVHVQLPDRGRAVLVGVKTTRMPFLERAELDAFTVDRLWRDLGLGDGMGFRAHASTYAGESPVDVARRAVAQAATAAGVPLEAVAAEWAAAHDGQSIRAATDARALELLAVDLRDRAARKEPVPS